MFSAYVANEIGADFEEEAGTELNKGYLTGAQAQPSMIRQERTGASDVVTEITYDLDANRRLGLPAHRPHRSAGQPHRSGIRHRHRSNNERCVHRDSRARRGPRLRTLIFNRATSRAGCSRRPPWRRPRARRARRPTPTNNSPGGGERVTTTDQSTDLSTVADYDAAGRLIRSVDAHARSSVSQYDGEGRLVYSRDDDGNETWRDYNVLGQLLRERHHIASLQGQPNANLTTSYTYDEAGRTIATETRRAEDDSLVSRSATEYTSDANGRTETQIDRYGNRSTSIYDHGGRLVTPNSTTPPAACSIGLPTSTTPWAAPWRTTNRRGVTNESEYDDLGRMTASTVSAGEYSFTTTYGYDKIGRQLWTLGPDWGQDHQPLRQPGPRHRRAPVRRFDDDHGPHRHLQRRGLPGRGR